MSPQTQEPLDAAKQAYLAGGAEPPTRWWNIAVAAGLGALVVGIAAAVYGLQRTPMPAFSPTETAAFEPDAPVSVASAAAGADTFITAGAAGSRGEAGETTVARVLTAEERLAQLNDELDVLREEIGGAATQRLRQALVGAEMAREHARRAVARLASADETQRVAARRSAEDALGVYMERIVATREVGLEHGDH